MSKTNTRSQTGKKHNHPQNRNQYSSSRTGIGGGKKKINPIEGKINTLVNYFNANRKGMQRFIRLFCT